MITIQKNVLLASLTTFKIGGSADYFVRVKSADELKEALAEAHELNVLTFFMGGGTNILVGDLGFRGMVIKLELSDIRLSGYAGMMGKKDEGERIVYIEAGAGVLTNRLVRYTLDQKLSGLEHFLGQPGTIGGAIYINAHNMKMHDFFGNHIALAHLLTPKGKTIAVDASYFKFGYDKSVIQKTGDIVLAVTFKLAKIDDDKELWERANAAASYRQQTQPYGVGSAGCTFRNPDGKSAGYLIDQCGLKGMRVGDAEISPHHANFIINHGKATASDVLQLIKRVKREVKKKFGITLHEEIVLVGEFTHE